MAVPMCCTCSYMACYALFAAPRQSLLYCSIFGHPALVEHKQILHQLSNLFRSYSLVLISQVKHFYTQFHIYGKNINLHSTKINSLTSIKYLCY